MTDQTYRIIDLFAVHLPVLPAVATDAVIPTPTCDDVYISLMPASGSRPNDGNEMSSVDVDLALTALWPS